jgi:hypothetical protein
MRYEGHGWDPEGPASIHRARAALDQDGAVIGYAFEKQGLLAHRHRHQRERPEHQPSRRAAWKHPLFDNGAEQLLLRDPYGNIIELHQVDKCRCRAVNRR